MRFGKHREERLSNNFSADYANFLFPIVRFAIIFLFFNIIQNVKEGSFRFH